MNLRIATRKSALALWQAERVRDLLGARGVACELVPMSTEGDRVLDRSLAEVGGKGLFVKELEQALSDGRADLAVHSAKDVPFALPEQFILSSFPGREDPRDALVAPSAKEFEKLPRGARVGTSSLRRAVQLLAARPDLVIVPVRGNVQTRLARATGGTVMRGGVEVRPADGDPQGPLDAVVLALAGLRRLGLEQHVTEVLPVSLSLPAAGQGALAIEAVRGSAGERETAPLDDHQTALCVRAERAVLARLAGGCTVPVAAHATFEGGGQLWLRAALGGPDRRGGVSLIRAEARAADPEALGRGVAEELLARGGAPLLEAARAQAGGLPAPKRA
ncbi:MAG TPA: hydroxymethylbilane synthase [Myxococcales bacterium]|nr:hydroxymethylbilane synthase [Myxococcales bacterium]